MFQQTFVLSPDEKQIDCIVRTGVGLWVSYKHSAVLQLYHVETLVNLQEINIASSVIRLLGGKIIPCSTNFSFQPVLHDWCNKGCGMCYPVCGMVHIKEPLLLIGKSSQSGSSRFPLSLSEWSFTMSDAI